MKLFAGKIMFISLMVPLVFVKFVRAEEIDAKIRREADYILACQYINAGNTATGAINNVYGNPTWVVPRENAMAILGLIIASDVLNDNTYVERAQLAADYLLKIQDSDGAWCNQYNYVNVVDHAKSLTQTAEVMIAFYKLGYNSKRYNSMKRGADFLMACQKVENKQGRDDGLIGGGKDANGDYCKWRWTHDNAYAYQALKAAQAWASIQKDDTFAEKCGLASQRIIEGINNYLYNSPVWYIAIDEWGNSQGNPDTSHINPDLPNWISYSPAMLDLPVNGTGSPEVGKWIKNSFQQSDGSCIGYIEDKTRKYPGLSFQASLCWYDSGQNSYAQEALSWAENSGLWQITADGTGIAGGWIDWVEVYPDAGKQPGDWERFIDTSFYAIACFTGGYDFNTTHTLNLDTPWYENKTPYFSSGAAVSQMILNYIREGAEEPLLTQEEIYEYACFPKSFGSELTPDEVDKALGHFDPYDYLISNWSNNYNSYPDGNPYKGYNFTVDTYDPFSNPDAFNEYVRDICHWMAYTVTKEDWWKKGELAAHPNTPAAVPVFGTYDHWVVIKGYAASVNPCPQPLVDPYNTPDFTVYGFWITDPLSSGIGKNTYKTVEECASTYFLPLSTGDAYQGMFLQVAEPPLKKSQADVKLRELTGDLANLEFAGIKIEPENKNVRMRSGEAFLFSNSSKSEDYSKIKQSWRDIVDTPLLTDPAVIKAFTGTRKAKPILVNNPGNKKLNYYLLPFNRYVKGKFLTSAVVVLNADDGCFKEASWAETPKKFFPVGKSYAISLIKQLVTKEFSKELRNLRKYSGKKYRSEIVKLYIKYGKLFYYINKAKTQLLWQPGGYSQSPYKPYWEVNANGYIWFVTQDKDVIPQVNIKTILKEIERNITVLNKFGLSK